MENLHLFLFSDKSDSLGMIIRGFQQKYPNLLSGLSSDNVTEAFLRRVFSIGFDSTVYISNRSINDNTRQILTIRPKMSPQLESVLPEGRSFMLQGTVDLARPNPTLTIHKLFEVPDAESRFYEKEMDVVVQLVREGDYSKREDSIFNLEFVSELPKISQQTESRLEDWYDYLNWRDAIAQSRLEGLRFIKCHIEEAPKDGDEANFDLVLTVICESEIVWKRYCRRYLFNMTMALLSVNSSTNPFEFTIDKSKAEREIRLGEYRKSKIVDSSLSFKKLDELEIPWDSPIFATIHFRIVNEDQLNALRSSTAEMVEIRAAELVYKNYLEQGFIVPSTVGDVALINRQRRAISNLNSEENEAPFLTSWLFDIDKANIPTEDDLITYWNRTDLNESQKEAVQGMLNAPDVFLLQGPPGTGKTTVIAEAIYQMVNRNQKVLLSSQANLAVDNVFERLAATPEIRMIRLGSDQKISEEGKQFAEKNVLSFFYQSIANQVDKRFTGRWNQQDRELNTWKQLQQEYHYLQHDLIARQQQIQEIQQLVQQLKNQKQEIAHAYEAIRQKNEENRQQRYYYNKYKQWLTTGENQEFLIPFSVAKKTWDQFLTPEKQFEMLGISLFQHTDVEWNEQQVGTFIQSLRLNVLRIRQLIDEIPTIQQDLHNLKNGTSLSTETQLELETIEKRLLEIQSLLMGEDAIKYLQEFKELNQRKMQLQHTQQASFGLIYERMYMTHNGMTVRQQLEEYKQQQRSFEQVDLLQKLDQLAQFYKIALPTIVERLLALILSQEQQLVDEQIEERPLREIEAKIQYQNLELKQLQGNYQELQHRQHELVNNVQQKIQQQVDESQLTEVISLQIANIEKSQNEEVTLREDLRPLLDEWAVRLKSKKQAKADHDFYIETYINACNVVGISCTEHPKVLEKADHTSFDVTIIDEVSKATPPELLIPMVRARKTILVGDHRQLPPIFSEHEKQYKDHLESVQEEDEELLTEANFQRFQKMVTSSLFKEYFEEANPLIKSSLLVQYRMHPQIMDMINHFYEHRLECGLSDPDKIRAHQITIPSTRGLSFITLDKHAYWVDTTTDPSGKVYYERQDGTSKVNDLEKNLILEFLRKLDESLANQNLSEKKDVGVISFYGKQIRDLRRVCRKENFQHIKVDINTVDRFQGKEKSIVVVSMVRHAKMDKKYKRPTSHIASFQRINVAFSRAKELLVVFGAKDFYEDWPVTLPKMDKTGEDTYPVYGAILNGIHQVGGLFTSADIISAQNYASEEGAANGNNAEQVAASHN